MSDTDSPMLSGPKDPENQINPEVLQNISVTMSIEVGRAMIKKLKAYKGEAHPHAAQQPKPIDLK